MLSNRKYIGAGCVCLLATLILSPLSAGDTEAKLESKALDLLRSVCDAYQGAKSIRGSADMNWRIVSRNWDQNIRSRFKIFADKPHRFALQMTNGTSAGSVIFDGEKLFTHMPYREAYAVEDAPPGLESVHAAMALIAETTGMPGISLVSFLVGDDPYAAIMNGVTAAEYVEADRVDGKKCEHIHLTRGDETWDLWLTTGKRIGIARFESTVPEGELHFDGYTIKKDDELTIRVGFGTWKFDKKMRDKNFAYKIPRNTREVESFPMVALAEKQHPLIGERAPKLTMSLYEGGKINLSKHKGKHVVVLDFWATWCGPCLRAMPDVIEVTDSLKNRGVYLYAVNQGESKDLIKKFLDKHKFDCTIATDGEMKVGRKFDVNSYPTTVIIGRDGTVQSVHSGWSPNYKTMLREELEKLLNGETLASN